MAVGQALDVHHDGPARLELADVQGMAAAAFHAEDAGALVDDAPQAAVEAAQRARVVHRLEPLEGHVRPSRGLLALAALAAGQAVLEPVEELLEGAGGGVAAQLAHGRAVVLAPLAGQEPLHVGQEEGEVVVLAVAVAEEVGEEVVADDVLQRPAIGADAAPSHGRRQLVAAGLLGGEEGQHVQRGGLAPAHGLPHEPVLLAEGPRPVVQPEEVEALDVEDDGPHLGLLRVLRVLLGVAAAVAQDLAEDDGQEAGLGPHAGDAGHVQVPALGAEQVVQVHVGGPGDGVAAVTHQADDQGLLHLAHAVGDAGLRLPGRVDQALLAGRREDGWAPWPARGRRRR